MRDEVERKWQVEYCSDVSLIADLLFSYIVDFGETCLSDDREQDTASICEEHFRESELDEEDVREVPRMVNRREGRKTL